MREWEKYAVCPRCGEIYHAPFGSVFHIHFDVCPNCGQIKSDWQRANGFPAWEVFTLRWVSDSEFWKFSTWGTGHWEERRGDEVLRFEAKEHIKITWSFN